MDWHQASSFHLKVPFEGVFGKFTSAMAGLYLIGFAAPAFEAAACHVGETIDPNKNVPRAMFASAGMATLYFLVLPVIWLGVFGPKPLTGDLAAMLGPTFAPLFGGMAKAAAIWFMVLNMFHGTLTPVTGVARTLSQLSEDGLLPRVLARRSRHDVPWVASALTGGMAIAFLLSGDPVWVIAAANFTYLIGIALPSVAVWLLRKNEPDLHRPYRAPRGTIVLGLVAAFGLGHQHGVRLRAVRPARPCWPGSASPTPAPSAYAWRQWRDRAGAPKRVKRSLHLKLTGAMLAVLTLDGAGYLLAVSHVTHHGPDADLGPPGHLRRRRHPHDHRGAGAARHDRPRRDRGDQGGRPAGERHAGRPDPGHAGAGRRRPRRGARPGREHPRRHPLDRRGRRHGGQLQRHPRRGGPGRRFARRRPRGAAAPPARPRALVDQRTVHAAQQAAVAELGRVALVSSDASHVVDRAVEAITRTLHADAGRFGHLPAGGSHARAESSGGRRGAEPDGGRPASRRGPGGKRRWPPSSRCCCPAATSGPMFGRTPGCGRGMWATIAVRQQAFGGLLVHSDDPTRAFAQDDLNFLEAVANVVGSAIDRIRTEAEAQPPGRPRPADRLPNRVLFADRLTQALARLHRQPGTIAVLFVDVDHFKVINDSLGHEQGDQLLTMMSERLESAVRPGDTVARFGGDEFVILCENLIGEIEAGRDRRADQ